MGRVPTPQGRHPVRAAITIAVGTLLLAGCAARMDTTEITATATEAQQCQRGGGWWRANLGVCDWPGTGSGKQ